MYPNKHIKAELQVMKAQQMSDKASKRIKRETMQGIVMALIVLTVLMLFAFLATTY